MRGFTLIELMIVVAMVAILGVLGIAGYNVLVKRNVISETSNTMMSAINLARAEAISRNVRVTACKSANGASCAPSGGWEQGWIIFLDAGDGISGGTVGVRDAGEELVQRYGRIHGSLNVMGKGALANYISLVGSGIPRKADDTFLDEASDYFVLCMNSLADTHLRVIRVGRSGRAAVLTSAESGITSCN
jgi:type IV fimbrial biogenesis protein FimT